MRWYDASAREKNEYLDEHVATAEDSCRILIFQNKTDERGRSSLHRNFEVNFSVVNSEISWNLYSSKKKPTAEGGCRYAFISEPDGPTRAVTAYKFRNLIVVAAICYAFISNLKILHLRHAEKWNSGRSSILKAVQSSEIN